MLTSPIPMSRMLSGFVFAIWTVLRRKLECGGYKAMDKALYSRERENMEVEADVT